MVTYGVSATVTRATQYDRNEFRKLAMSSGTSSKEFSASVDLTVSPLPTFPILIGTPDIDVIKFLGLVVTGGSATIRLTKTNAVYNNIDLVVEGTLLLSGIDLTQVVVIGTPSGSCYIEAFGMGT